eukprot:9235945-Lingulodinium_polyedra.AAC.1
MQSLWRQAASSELAGAGGGQHDTVGRKQTLCLEKLVPVQLWDISAPLQSLHMLYQPWSCPLVVTHAVETQRVLPLWDGRSLTDVYAYTHVRRLEHGFAWACALAGHCTNTWQ